MQGEAIGAHGVASPDELPHEMGSQRKPRTFGVRVFRIKPLAVTWCGSRLRRNRNSERPKDEGLPD
jgi:hypothetical protein